jgi:hypothetical protein
MVERGRDSDSDDFLWLLYNVANDGEAVPVLGEEELHLVEEAAPL